MVAHDPATTVAAVRLDGDEVEAQPEARDGTAIGQSGPLAELVATAANRGPLAPVDGLLRQAEVAPGTPANLDDHEGRRRTRVDGDEVELGSPHPDLTTEDLPTRSAEPRGDERLRRVTLLLPCRAHGRIIAADAAR